MNTPSELELMPSVGAEEIRAEIDSQVATAKRYPRPAFSVIKAKLTAAATADQETAESCFYTLRRKNKDGTQKMIQGPSIRLAELAHQCYGNLRVVSRVVGFDGKRVKVQAIAQDFETNNTVAMELARSVTTKDGKTFSEDMITMVTNAAASIARRNAMIAVIGRALTSPALEAAKQVASGDAKSLRDKRSKVIERFNQTWGVPQEKVLAFLGKKSIEDVTLDDVQNLIGLGTAIRDGEMTIDEAFEAPATTAPPVDLKAPSKPTEKAPEPPEAQKPTPPDAAVQPGADCASVLKKAEAAGISEAVLLEFLVAEGQTDGSASCAAEVPAAVWKIMIKSWASLCKRILEFKGAKPQTEKA